MMSANDDKPDSKRPLRDGVDDAKGQVAEAASATRAVAKKAAGDVAALGRDAKSPTRDAFSGGSEGSPLLVLAGGAAVGILVGTLLPRTEREGALFGALGARLVDAAQEAVGAAREAGRDKLDEAGLSRDGARDAVRGILDSALAAAFSAGSAAADAARHKVVDQQG